MLSEIKVTELTARLYSYLRSTDGDDNQVAAIIVRKEYQLDPMSQVIIHSGHFTMSDLGRILIIQDQGIKTMGRMMRHFQDKNKRIRIFMYVEN